jgi:hypothetical protein
MIVDEGDPAMAECRAFGIALNPPQAVIFSWRREGAKFSNGKHAFDGERYEIPNATRDDAGFYFCTAKSEKDDETKTASLQIVVRYQPVIARMEKATLRTGSGLGLEVACVMSANPEPKVTWYKDGEVRMSCHDHVKYNFVIITTLARFYFPTTERHFLPPALATC